MERFDVFNRVHKALRAMLYHAALCLQQTDFSQAEEREAALQKVKSVLQLFDAHSQQEDEYVLNAIAAFESSVIDVFKLEHVQDLKHFINISKALDDLEATTHRSQAISKGKTLVQVFTTFMTYNLGRMNKEEEVLNRILWRYYTDNELQALEAEIIQATQQENEAFLLKWMMRGLNNAELVTWLKAAEHEATGLLFQKLFATAEKELSKKRFSYLVEELTSGVMLV